jgi:alkylhydroperoxidase family enzyme
VNDRPAAVTRADVERARAHGWTDAALFDAVTVCAVFNFFNRWIDGTGVEDVPAGFYEARLRAHGDVGYAL